MNENEVFKMLCAPKLSQPQRQHNTTSTPTNHRNTTLALRSLRLTFVDLNVISNNKQGHNNNIKNNNNNNNNKTSTTKLSALEA